MLSKSDKRGILLMAVSAVALVAMMAVVFMLKSKPKLGSDNCLANVTANTVIVLDHSERISEQTSKEIVSRAMNHISTKVKVNERVTVFTISDLSKSSLIPLLSLCKPPEDGNRVYENVKGIQKRFREQFQKPLEAALAVTPPDGKESPIAQALTDISLSQYMKGKSNSLLVFSDMLENTEKFTLYRCTSSMDTVSRYRETRRGAQERPEFKNTDVVLNLIPRLDQSREVLKCRDQLWPWFFGNNSGANAGFSSEYLPGGIAEKVTEKGGKK